MKTIKAYGIWSPICKRVHPRDVYRTPSDARRDAETGRCLPWPELRKQGFRVIPVTITYDEPEVRK
jgi:hypothetical protein